MQLPQLTAISRALRSRNYRLFFAGQGLSLVGTWMTQTAVIWLVYQLTNSALLLGVVGFAQQIPNFLLSPFAGVWIDRWNRHQTLIVTQILSLLQSAALTGLAFVGMIDIRHIIALSIFQGIVNAVDVPARQSFVVELVDRREDLGNAIALNSSMFSGARLMGPAIAGLIIAAAGVTTCFAIDTISYIAVIASLLAMRLRPRKQSITPQKTGIFQQLREGFVYSFSFPPIRAILMLIGLVSLVGMPYTVLVPIFATNILKGGSETLGFLMAASGCGALVSAVYLSARASVLGLGRIIATAPAVFGIALIVFAQSQVLWLSLLAMFVMGGSLILQSTSSNTILQTIVEEDKRGRVMSLYSIAFISLVTFGNLFAGSLASRIGAPNTLVVGGSICIVGSIFFRRQLPALRELIRPIYIRLGLLSQPHPYQPHT
jgi:MFS family permease